MKNALKHNDSKFILIGKIKGLALESKKTRCRIMKAKKEAAVWNLAYRKHIIGIDTRHHLLAYALLRGFNYRMIEHKCAKGNSPRADLILKIIETHEPFFVTEALERGGISCKRYELTLEDVNAWLAEVI